MRFLLGILFSCFLTISAQAKTYTLEEVESFVYQANQLLEYQNIVLLMEAEEFEEYLYKRFYPQFRKASDRGHDFSPRELRHCQLLTEFVVLYADEVISYKRGNTTLAKFIRESDNQLDLIYDMQSICEEGMEAFKNNNSE
ncbi:hypothetical protein [Polycladidibacter stylochi]|uniref:hypothetical protein n=1 Tax=Polycladidibacter stylochi TaxID=1807766 RepID=UPI00083610FE|nr:hypothetical protein [Pseudovibrio stylochi]